MKRDFIALVSHEMRTPLTAIKGFTELLAVFWGRLDDNQRAQQVDAVERNTTRLQQLVDNQLAAATLGADQPTTATGDEARHHPVAPLLRTVVDDSGLERDDVMIRCPPVDIHNDADVVRTVVTNLLTNARKYGAAPFTSR